MGKLEEKSVKRDQTQINGQIESPQGADGMSADRAIQDNKRSDLVDESANGLDSIEVRDGQDGRNNRGIGSMDMDAKNGVLRMGDMDNSTMEVTDKALDEAAANSGNTNTATTASQQETEEDVAETGTSIDHQPTY